MKTAPECLACNVKSLRKALGMSQLRLAEKANVSKDFISQLERQNRWPKPENISKLAKALKCHETALFFDPENLSPTQILAALERMLKNYA